jgi:hypothetical protein
MIAIVILPIDIVSQKLESVLGDEDVFDLLVEKMSI